MTKAVKTQSGEKFHEQPCPVCRGSEWLDIYRLRDNRTRAFAGWFTVAECCNCQTVGLRPMPSQADLFAGYEHGYGPYPQSAEASLKRRPSAAAVVIRYL